VGLLLYWEWKKFKKNYIGFDILKVAMTDVAEIVSYTHKVSRFVAELQCAMVVNTRNIFFP